MKKLIDQLRGRHQQEVSPARQNQPVINTAQQLAAKEKQQITAYGSKKHWLQTQKFGW